MPKRWMLRLLFVLCFLVMVAVAVLWLYKPASSFGILKRLNFVIQTKVLHSAPDFSALVPNTVEEYISRTRTVLIALLRLASRRDSIVSHLFRDPQGYSLASDSRGEKFQYP
jgi:hypothetical protein